MKTVRFTNVVQQSGAPEVYLLLTDPEKDAHFQQALRAHRLMTIQHAATGSKTDFGTVGYDPKVRGEILVFPRSLRSFADARIVGINYDLLHQELEPEKPEPKPEPKTKPPTASPKPAAASQTELDMEVEHRPVSKKKPSLTKKSKPQPKADPSPKLKPKPAPQPPPKKVLQFPKPEPDDREDEENDETDEVTKIKSDIRRALKALEAGKQVVAFNILKRLVENP